MLRMGWEYCNLHILPEIHVAMFSAKFMYLENKLLLISINFTPNSPPCLKKWYFPMFSR